MYIHIYIYTHAYMYTHVNMYEDIHASVYACLYVYIHICVFVCTYSLLDDAGFNGHNRHTALGGCTSEAMTIGGEFVPRGVSRGQILNPTELVTQSTTQG